VGNEETMPKKNLKGILSKLKNTFITHCEQADVVEKVMTNVKYPSVFCGDLNEIANNNAYWKVIGDRQDAFLAKGFGFGKTFNFLSPVLRIDYIIPDNNFEVTQFTLIDDEMSDHKMLVVDLMLKKYGKEKTKN
jgi:endonuclease/exonuclease/phosphatase family metal-dependent hydrolase